MALLTIAGFFYEPIVSLLEQTDKIIEGITVEVYHLPAQPLRTGRYELLQQLGCELLKAVACELSSFGTGGADGIRTHHLLTASQTLSQLSYSPAKTKNITKLPAELKLEVQSQPSQYRAQTKVSQVGQYHILDGPAGPRGKEEPYPPEAKHTQKHGERVVDRGYQGCQEQDGFGAVAVNKIVETHKKTAAAVPE